MLARRDWRLRRGRMWGMAEINQEFVVRMEDVLRLHVRAYCASEPVVCLDERPVQFLDPSRPSVSMRAGRTRSTPARGDRHREAGVPDLRGPGTWSTSRSAAGTRTGRPAAAAARMAPAPTFGCRLPGSLPLANHLPHRRPSRPPDFHPKGRCPARPLSRSVHFLQNRHSEWSRKT
jgi:hypothetical protein